MARADLILSSSMPWCCPPPTRPPPPNMDDVFSVVWWEVFFGTMELITAYTPRSSTVLLLSATGWFSGFCLF